MLEGIEEPTAVQLYLDLMKRVLTDSVFVDDPLALWVLYRSKPTTSSLKRTLISILEQFLARYRLRLVEPYIAGGIDFQKVASKDFEAMRDRGEYWPARAHTMIGI